MATPMVLVAQYTALNSVDRSSWLNKSELTTMVEEKDVTTFTSLGWKAVTGGLFSGSLGLSFLNDVQDNQLDETMWTLFIAGVPITFEVRASNASVGTSNPKYTGSLLITEWKPVAGQVGELNAGDFTYPTSGVVTRAVA